MRLSFHFTYVDKFSLGATTQEEWGMRKLMAPKGA
jgi:hypothetical protein